MRVSWTDKDKICTGTIVAWLVVPAEDGPFGPDQRVTTYYNPSAIVAVDDGSFETIRVSELWSLEGREPRA